MIAITNEQKEVRKSVSKDMSNIVFDIISEMKIQAPHGIINYMVKVPD